jgi:hypothetical protein
MRARSPHVRAARERRRRAMALWRIRVRSKAGLPLHTARYCIPVEWTELSVDDSEIPALATNRWIECQLPKGMTVPASPGVPGGISVRVYVRAGRERITHDRFDFRHDARVVTVSPPELQRLRDDLALVVREHDPNLFPTTVFVRMRAHAQPVYRQCEEIGTTLHAYELAFDDFSQLRFDARVQVELMEPDSMPPLHRVRVSSRTGRPFHALSGAIPPERGVELDLYPRELEWIECHNALSYEACEVESEPAPAVAPAVVAAPAPPAIHQEEDVERGEPSAADRARVARLDDDAPFAHRLAAWAARPDVIARGRASDGFTLDQIFHEVDVADTPRTRALEMEVSNVMRRLGWEHAPLQRRNGMRVRPYRPPSSSQ